MHKLLTEPPGRCVSPVADVSVKAVHCYIVCTLEDCFVVLDGEGVAAGDFWCKGVEGDDRLDEGVDAVGD
ncbi:hypothetical protein J1614_009556 [Plenodomus biglobosus]|nr:hypothetical protein J1614_009556 [Plenodomus biglobosus]